jgi:hypothetical protein
MTGIMAQLEFQLRLTMRQQRTGTPRLSGGLLKTVRLHVRAGSERRYFDFCVQKKIFSFVVGLTDNIPILRLLLFHG